MHDVIEFGRPMPMPVRDDAEYTKDQKFILETLQELKGELKEETKSIHHELAKIQTEIALLKLKASLWGGGAGILAYAVTYALEMLKRR